MREVHDARTLLQRFAAQLRCALDAGIGLKLELPAEAAHCRVDAGELESVLTELARRVSSVMPREGVLRLKAERRAALPAELLVPSTTEHAPHGWLALSVGSTQADTPDLRWPVKSPRADLARFVRDTRSALSVRPLDGRGADIVLYLPCAGDAATAGAVPG
ncbi:MAG: hypothetical protein AB1430_22535 [Pseudomonadota bacterium]